MTVFYRIHPGAHGAFIGDPIGGRLAISYAAAGLEPPEIGQIPAHDALIAIIEKAKTFTAEAALDVSKTKAPGWAREAVEAHAHAEAARKLAGGVERLRPRHVMAQAAEIIDAGANDLRPAAEATLEQLATAANDLPDGDPLDQQAAFNAHVSREYGTAVEALDKLGKLATLFDAKRTSNKPPAHAYAILPIVDFPELAPHIFIQPRGWFVENSQARPKPDPQRDILFRFINDAKESVDSTLTRLARGEYAGAGLRLAWCSSHDELTARKQRLAGIYATETVKHDDPRALGGNR